MSITVLDPGPLTTVQDAGRVGYAAQGYRSCGAADGYAYRLGNVLVGNDPGAAVLECTLRGAALRFETDTVFALTGAESPAALDSTPVWSSVCVRFPTHRCLRRWPSRRACPACTVRRCRSTRRRRSVSPIWPTLITAMP